MSERTEPLFECPICGTGVAAGSEHACPEAPADCQVDWCTMCGEDYDDGYIEHLRHCEVRGSVESTRRFEIS